MNVEVSIGLDEHGNVLLKVTRGDVTIVATMEPDGAREVAKSLWNAATIGGAKVVMRHFSRDEN